MEAKKWMEQAEETILHTYNRYQIVLERGQGMYLYDTEGKKYLDFAAGIGVQALGYGNQEYNHALKMQIDRLLHTSNLYYNQPTIEAAEKLCKVSGLDRVFFTNSGTEAIEGAIKAAKKYAYDKDQTTDHEIIAMEHSFHGRSLGALAVTGNAHYREPFEPLPGIVKFAEYNHLESVESLVNDKTCAILMETIQGEGGIYPAQKEFLAGVKKICKEHDILLILDEIQCGMGRTVRSLKVLKLHGLRIFSDTLSLEIFVNDGEDVFTSRVYDSMENLRIWAAAGEIRGIWEYYSL